MTPKFDSPPASTDSFSQPRPRPPRSASHSAQIRAQNRRRAYLDKHPEYFQSSEHELADPLLYDFLIRRFQTPAEREAEGRAKGYARVLEGSLLRGEERLAKLRQQTGDEVKGDESLASSSEFASPSHVTAVGLVSPAAAAAAAAAATATATATATPPPPPPPTTTTTTTTTTPAVTASGTSLGTTFTASVADLTPPPRTKLEGQAQWQSFLRDRFVRGEDTDFDYASHVDHDDEYDVLERAAREDAWFDEEEAAWASSGSEGDDDGSEGEVDGIRGGSGDGNGGVVGKGDGDVDMREGSGEGKGVRRDGGTGGGRKRRAEKVLMGETGVQDF